MGKDLGVNMSKATGAKRPPITQIGARKHPRLTELQQQQQQQRRGRLKPRRIYYPTKLGVPRAPRNTSSFIMDAKKPRPSMPLVSPVTAAAAAAAGRFAASAPDKEGLDNEVDKEWGVDSYGSMNGLITRLRSVDDGGREGFGNTGEREEEQFSGAESVQKLEQRIDHRFEIVWPPWRSLVISSPKANLHWQN